MRRAKLPAPARVRKCLAYDKRTGALTWKLDRGPVRAGSKAGSLAPKGYIQVGFEGTQFGAHVLAWVIVTGKWPKAHLDHINGDGRDNRWANLREATAAQNGRNRKRANANNRSTGVRGVYRLPGGKFHAFLHLSVGRFASLAAAQIAIERARRLYHGRFASSGGREHGR